MRTKILLLVFCFFFITVPKAFADDNFDISANASYDVADNGRTRVTQTIRITNKTEFTYTPTYTIITGINDIKNLKVTNSSGNIPYKLEDKNSNDKSIEIAFPNKVVGLGRVNEFTVSFDTNLVATKKGSIWEVSVPGLSNPAVYSDYRVTLNVPEAFGEPTVTKPTQALATSGPYFFTKNEVGSSGVLILFGKSQYYKLSLSYHIKNDGVVPVKTELALPPDTSYQDIRIQKLTPQPLDVYQDADGNWLAIYALSSGQKQTIKAEIIARVFSSPVFSIDDPSGYLSASKYWEVTNPEIKRIAQELKTPAKIYDYVVDKLKYNYGKIESNNTRLGAANSIRQPDYAVCLEFTDLFVALSRASGIQARSVEGYAYTQDPKLRPLSLVQDVLHSWPEYYDKERKAWIMVDPTWGNTTRGLDYFNSFDFDHIAFVIKGKDSTYPVPAGGYKGDQETKDVNVSFALSDDFKNIVKTNMTSNFPKYIFPTFALQGHVTLYNQGNMAIRGKTLRLESDLEPNKQEYYVDAILPYGKKSINVVFEKTSLLTSDDHNITMHFDGNSVSQKVAVGFFPDYYFILLGGVIIIGSTTVSVIAYKTWRLYIQKREKQNNLHREGPQS